MPSQIDMAVIETSCGPIEYAQAGTGPPVLYFHGTGITCSDMLRFEMPLVESGFRVIVFNRPGYGETPLGGNTSAESCSRVAHALLDSLGISTASVMGSSGGATFAMSFTVCYLLRVNSLVLLCPNLHRWSDVGWLPSHSQNRGTLICLRNPWLRRLSLKLYAMQLRRFTIDQFLKMEAGMRYEIVRDDQSVRDFCKSCLEAMVDGPSHAGFENDMRVFVSEDVLLPSSSIQPPTLVLHDCEDPMAPVAHVDWLRSLHPSCECITLQTAGHLVWAGPDAGLMHESRVSFVTRFSEGQSFRANG